MKPLNSNHDGLEFSFSRSGSPGGCESPSIAKQITLASVQKVKRLKDQFRKAIGSNDDRSDFDNLSMGLEFDEFGDGNTPMQSYDDCTVIRIESSGSLYDVLRIEEPIDSKHSNHSSPYR